MNYEKDWQKEIMNMFRQFRLGNSFFQNVHRITRVERDHWEGSAIDHKKIMLNEIRHRLADFILKHQETATKETELENGELEIRTELLVLKMDEFKTIVEAAIQMTPDYKIAEIKAGKSI
jgi:CRISPR/Cas system-associated endonuclease/helicase Cas3